jgi:ribosomal protein S18 acetylase RimI-like enzyme
MHIRRARTDEESVRWFVEELWIPYLRDLESAVEAQEVADDIDVEEIVDWRTDWFDDPTRRLWVAVDDTEESSGPLHELNATFAGFLGSALQTPPSKFETAEQVILGNFYVDPEYRGTGVADDLVARALQHAREDGAVELALDVAVDNERALAYYEKLGFDVKKYRMCVPLDEVDLETES